jgi:hypothetical protein
MASEGYGVGVLSTALTRLGRGKGHTGGWLTVHRAVTLAGALPFSQLVLPRLVHRLHGRVVRLFARLQLSRTAGSSVEQQGHAQHHHETALQLTL